MRVLASLLLGAVLAGAAYGDDMRQLGAHEHGVGKLNIALEGKSLAMELEAPGADIAGFEHAATSDEDKSALEAALSQLESPLDLFGLPEDAECSVVESDAELLGGEDHEDHDHDEHDHEGHDEAMTHTEIYAEYLLFCEAPAELTSISFSYFDVFPNSEELEVQVISDKGSSAFEVTRDVPTLDLSDL